MDILPALLKQHSQLKFLKFICMHLSHYTLEDIDDIINVLQTDNTTLEHCILAAPFTPAQPFPGSNPCVESPYWCEFNYFCVLNKAGRGYLHNPAATLETVVSCIGTLESMVSSLLNLPYNFMDAFRTFPEEVTLDSL